MAFFDKKEEVIDLQLTQYGKYLLSIGEFTPEYYSFFDDGIIYDGKYAGLIEDQNNIEKRIEENISMKTQYVFRGVETRFNELVESVQGKIAGAYDKKRKLERLKSPYYQTQRLQQDPLEKNNSLKYSIATSGVTGKKLPRFSVYPHASAEFNTGKSMTYFTGSGNHLPIPQVACKSEYIVRKVQNPEFIFEENDYHISNIKDQLLTSKELFFIDGMKVIVNGDGIMLEFVEDNVPFSSENFELEIFEVTPSDRNNITPDDSDVLKENLLEPMVFNLDPELSEKYVGDYFMINLDGQIAEELMANRRSELDRNYYDSTRRDSDSSLGAVLDTYKIYNFDELVEDCEDPEDDTE